MSTLRPHFLILLLVWVSSALAQPNEPPQRIISCAPNLTEILFALGAGDSVIGVTRYCKFPEEAEALPKFGDLFNPSLEAMVAADPDMIVLYPSSTKVIQYFEERPKVRVVVTNKCESLDEINATIEQLGAAVHRPEKARELIQNTRAGLQQLRETWGERPRPRVLMIAGRKPNTLEQLYAVSRDTYITELLEAAGGVNVLDSSLGRYPQINREILLTLDPDVILEFHHNEESEEVRREIQRAWSPYKSFVTAVREDRVYPVTDKHLTIPGAHLEDDARLLREVLEKAFPDTPHSATGTGDHPPRTSPPPPAP